MVSKVLIFALLAAVVSQGSAHGRPFSHLGNRNAGRSFGPPGPKFGAQQQQQQQAQLTQSPIINVNVLGQQQQQSGLVNGNLLGQQGQQSSGFL